MGKKVRLEAKSPSVHIRDENKFNLGGGRENGRMWTCHGN